MSQDYEILRDENEPENDDFFEFSEPEEEYRQEGGQGAHKLLVAATVLLASILAIVLCIFGVRSLSAAKDNAGFEGNTWVISGTYQDLTPDLQTKSNVATYSGNLPSIQEMDGVSYVSYLKDVEQVQAGQLIEFRGSQTGNVKADFPDKVDALLAKTGDKQVEVIRTGSVGSLQPITEGTVTGQQITGWGMLLAAIVVFAGGIFGAMTLIRRARAQGTA